MTEPAHGWAVTQNGQIAVRSVSPTRRAAIINWLVVEAQVRVYNAMTDEQVERLWGVHSYRAEATVRPVTIAVDGEAP